MFGSFQCIKVVRIGFEVPGPVADCAAARPVLASVRFAAGPSFQSQAASHLLWVFVVKGTSNKYRKRDRQDSNSCMDFLNGFLPLGFKSARARDWARTEC